MGCLCYCECNRKRLALNVVILILSSICVVLNSIALGIDKYLEDSAVFEIVLIIINSIASGVQSFQLHLEKSEKGKNDKDDLSKSEK